MFSLESDKMTAGPTNLDPIEIQVQKNFGYKKMLPPKKCGVKKFCAWKKAGSKKVCF